ncbi:hypothetical protein RNM50_003709 [Escherichia coli]|nr:hypothetical protein [Escherichia coli]EGK7414053.1 hypothetical protein [Escherichia coli]EGN2070636.1 hypothetical protein [Escherichia coli]EGO6766472.1 hypothetical protein [Escherichia coli]EGO7578251.1 hypothetical protein [Escherichia coli]
MALIAGIPSSSACLRSSAHTRRYGVSLIHLDASAEYLPGLPTFDW